MMIARQRMDPTARFFLKESSFFGVFILAADPIIKISREQAIDISGNFLRSDRPPVLQQLLVGAIERIRDLPACMFPLVD